MGEEQFNTVTDLNQDYQRMAQQPVLTRRILCVLGVIILLALLAVPVSMYQNSFWTRNDSVESPTTQTPPTRNKRDSIKDFNVENSIIPTGEILSGGPPKDGIPAIHQPRFISITDAGFLKPNDIVVSVTIGGETRAYPHRILVWHEIVNDTIQNQPIVITYCPLCGTSMVFDRSFNDKTATFGVSGLLYNSDVLLYDRESESLWSQILMKSVSGTRVGTDLVWLPMEEMTWQFWKTKYPTGTVLSLETGHRRDYNRAPYENYAKSDETMFDTPYTRTELPKKSWVIGVRTDGEYKAYPIGTLSPEHDSIDDTIGNTQITLKYDLKTHWFEIINAKTGENIPYVKLYWFAWQAFYPNTLIHE
jgi:hypothetical protein